jgi:hypothetical protein
VKKTIFLAALAVACNAYAAASQPVSARFGVVDYKIDPAHKADTIIFVNGKNARLAEGEIAVATDIRLAKGSVGEKDYVLVSARSPTDTECPYTTFVLSGDKGHLQISEGAQLCGLPEHVAARGDALYWVVDGKIHSYSNGQIR